MRLGDLEQRILLACLSRHWARVTHPCRMTGAQSRQACCAAGPYGPAMGIDVSGLRMFRRSSIEAYRQPSPARWRASTTRSDSLQLRPDRLARAEYCSEGPQR